MTGQPKKMCFCDLEMVISEEKNLEKMATGSRTEGDLDAHVCQNLLFG